MLPFWKEQVMYSYVIPFILVGMIAYLKMANLFYFRILKWKLILKNMTGEWILAIKLRFTNKLANLLLKSTPFYMDSPKQTPVRAPAYYETLLFDFKIL